MRKLLAATAALATLTGTPLFAADMALKAPPLPGLMPASEWSQASLSAPQSADSKWVRTRLR